MRGPLWRKLGVGALLAVLLVLGYLNLGKLLSLDYLATQEELLHGYQQDHPWLTYAFAFLIYAGVTGLSLPGATVLSLLYAWFFGLVAGVVLISFASTTGATIAFLFSRYLFRSAIQEKFGKRLLRFNEALQREGPFYLFTLRLIPAIPFFVINVVMGLTPLKTFTYWWVSQLGMLPATFVYVYAGSSVPTLAQLAERGTSGILTPKILGALVLLGLFPLVARFALSRLSSRGT